MSDPIKAPIGSIGWVDLTTDKADELKEFYSAVIGWQAAQVKMGDYNDYTMLSPNNNVPYAGVCNAKGPNENLPPHWLIYFTVLDIEGSCNNVKALGGEVLFDPKVMGDYGKYCVIRDPAGAYCALFEPLEK